MDLMSNIRGKNNYKGIDQKLRIKSEVPNRLNNHNANNDSRENAKMTAESRENASFHILTAVSTHLLLYLHYTELPL